jgi:hypothetical protein
MTTAPVPAPGSESAPAPVASAPPEHRHPIFLPHFRNLWLGSSTSLLGSQCYLVAMPWLVLQMTGSSLALGTIMMTATIPRTVLMLVGGAVTDRVSPRRVLIATATTRTFLVGAVSALVWLHLVELWQLYLLTFMFGVADAFSVPAGGALIPSLVAPQQLPRAHALLQSSVVLIQMLGPAPAGLIIKGLGIASAFFIDALSFLAVIAALFKIPDPPRPPAPPAGAPPRPGVLRSIGEGWRAVWNDPPLLALTVLFTAINLCVIGPTGVGLPALAKFQFGTATALGILLSCFSGGTLAGVLLGGLVKQPRWRGPKILTMSALSGLGLLAVGLVTQLAAIGAFLVLAGLGVGFINVQFAAWAQMRIDRALLGRVHSVVILLAVGLVPVSYAVSGVLAQWSLPGLFIVAGALLTAASSTLALASKAAREVD